MGKTLKFFFKVMRPSAYKFSMLQCLVFSYINPANHAPGVQRATFMRPTTQVSSIGLISLLLNYALLIFYFNLTFLKIPPGISSVSNSPKQLTAKVDTGKQMHTISKDEA